jgi:hypothetical protein
MGSIFVLVSDSRFELLMTWKVSPGPPAIECSRWSKLARDLALFSGKTLPSGRPVRHNLIYDLLMCSRIIPYKALIGGQFDLLIY